MSEESIDLNEFMERVQDDKALLLELLDIYREDYKEKRKLLAEALASNNYEEIRGIAHSLKGASGNISAKPVRNIFLQFEEMGKVQNTAGYQKQLSDLDVEYTALDRWIEQLKKELV